MKNSNFEYHINPFFWVSHDDSFSFCLANVDSYQCHIFKSRKNEGFYGNGYDWQSLAVAFLQECPSSWHEIIYFDSEAEMFCAYSKDKEVLQSFALQFKMLCENDERAVRLLKDAELD